MSHEMLRETPQGLYCPAGDFHIDPWAPVPRAVITHAHGDHARPGSIAYLCAAPCAPVLARRFGPTTVIEPQPYGTPITLGSVRVSFHPAGHILGSAQIRVEGPEGVWVITGDFKRAADPTCAPFEPLPCDTFVTESTFGLPIYTWDETSAVIQEIVQWWEANRAQHLTSVLFVYTLGKAQRVLAELTRFTDQPVLVHGMLIPMIDAYRAAGITMLPTTALVDRPKGTSTAGELVLAPLSARGTPWMRRLGDLSDGFASGLMHVRGVRRQRGFDRGFVLSDHADWPSLLQTVSETGARRLLTTHGHAEPLARYFTERGLDAAVIRTAWEGEAGSEAAL
jgi:putative mRNA 3-end processing factor